MGACLGAQSTHATQYNYTKYKYNAIILMQSIPPLSWHCKIICGVTYSICIPLGFRTETLVREFKRNA